MDHLSLAGVVLLIFMLSSWLTKIVVTRKFVAERNSINNDLMLHNAKLSSDLERYKSEIVRINTELGAAEKARDKYECESKVGQAEIISLRMALAGMEKEREIYEKAQKESSTTQRLVFEKITKDSFGDSIKELENKINNLIKPIKEQSEKSAHDQGSLRQMYADLSYYFKTLTSSFKTMGDWGEQQLDNLLEAHGLVEGIDYEVQKVNEAGRRPDYTIKYSNGIEVIIDVKTPTDNYASFVNTQDKVEAERYLKQFVSNIRDRIKDLSSKDYASLNKSIDLVIMYIPIEGAFIQALKQEPSLYTFGMSKRIMLASTSEIFLLLHSLRYFRQQELFNKNAEEICKEATNLIDRLAILSEDMCAVQLHLKKAQGACENSIKYASSRIINTIDNITKLGAKEPSSDAYAKRRPYLEKIVEESDVI